MRGKKNPTNDLVSTVSNSDGELNLSDDNILISPKQQMVERKASDAGVTRPLVYKRMFEGLNATKKVTELLDGRMIVTEEADMTIRHKYLDTALRVLGDLKDSGVNVGVGVSVKVSKQESELLEAYKRG